MNDIDVGAITTKIKSILSSGKKWRYSDLKKELGVIDDAMFIKALKDLANECRLEFEPCRGSVNIFMRKVYEYYY